MARGYRLLCPIARALDRVGDRWTLLVLRDLHGGPMRFGELQRGLPGLASNLLTSRLQALHDAQLVAHDGARYSLTELGRASSGVLWELAKLGMRFPPDPQLKQPGHLRFVAVTLEQALRQVAPAEVSLTVELVLDGESFTLRLDGGAATVRYGAPVAPAVVAHSSYEPMMAAAAGDLPLEAFRAEHTELSGPPEAVAGFRELMGAVMQVLGAEAGAPEP